MHTLLTRFGTKSAIAAALGITPGGRQQRFQAWQGAKHLGPSQAARFEPI